MKNKNLQKFRQWKFIHLTLTLLVKTHINLAVTLNLKKID